MTFERMGDIFVCYMNEKEVRNISTDLNGVRLRGRSKASSDFEQMADMALESEDHCTVEDKVVEG